MARKPTTVPRMKVIIAMLVGFMISRRSGDGIYGNRSVALRANRFKMAQMRSARCPLFGRYEGKSDLADIAFFVDTVVIRGTAEKLGEPPPGTARGCCEQHFVPARDPRAVVTASEIYMLQSEPPCSRKSTVPVGIFGSLASSNGAQPIDRAEV
jgi:hypothetical protein